MIFGIRFPRLRLIAVGVVLLAQLYLFFCIRHVIQSSNRSDRFKFWATHLVGGAISLLFLLNTYSMFKHVPWVNPPFSAQVGLFYPVAAWNLGSLFSAAFLFLMRLAGRLAGMLIRLFRDRVGEVALNPVHLGRRRFLQAGVGGLAAAPLMLSDYGAVYAAWAYDVEEFTLPFGRSLLMVHLEPRHAGHHGSSGNGLRHGHRHTEVQHRGDDHISATSGPESALSLFHTLRSTHS